MAIKCNLLNLEQIKELGQQESGGQIYKWQGVSIQRITESIDIWYTGGYSYDDFEQQLFKKFYNKNRELLQLPKELKWIEINGNYRIIETGEVFLVDEFMIKIPAYWFEMLEVSHQSTPLRKIRHFLNPRRWSADGFEINLDAPDYDDGYHEDHQEEGPFGGAFSSWRSYHCWRDSALFR